VTVPKVLVVEDEPLIRIGLVSLVEDAGYEVREAANADDAIRIVEREPDIHVIVTVVDMPGSMDGVKLAHFVRGRWPPIHLIVVSGKIGVGATELPSGTRFFSKPLREEMLLAAIREMSGGSASS
jgi:CheY-like chemotaxis protein